jgi:hypothetical protein
MNLAEAAISATESHDIRHFIIFLENNDGNAYNLLMRDLSSIYTSVHNDREFFAAGIFRAFSFVQDQHLYFCHNYAKDRNFFYSRRREVVAYVAAEFVNSAMAEFKLGNFYTA